MFPLDTCAVVRRHDNDTPRLGRLSDVRLRSEKGCSSASNRCRKQLEFWDFICTYVLSVGGTAVVTSNDLLLWSSVAHLLLWSSVPLARIYQRDSEVTKSIKEVDTIFRLWATAAELTISEWILPYTNYEYSDSSTRCTLCDRARNQRSTRETVSWLRKFIIHTVCSTTLVGHNYLSVKHTCLGLVFLRDPDPIRSA